MCLELSFWNVYELRRDVSAQDGKKHNRMVRGCIVGCTTFGKPKKKNVAIMIRVRYVDVERKSRQTSDGDFFPFALHETFWSVWSQKRKTPTEAIPAIRIATQKKCLPSFLQNENENGGESTRNGVLWFSLLHGFFWDTVFVPNRLFTMLLTFGEYGDVVVFFLLLTLPNP